MFPNLSPYDHHSAVVAIGDRHPDGPGDLRPEDVADALTLAAAYLTLLPRRERNGAVGWNYGPAAGSSVPHPHLQVVASSRLSEAQAREQQAEARFAARTGRSFWAELLSAEAGGPRCLGGAAGWSALVAFAPRGCFPTCCSSPGM